MLLHDLNSSTILVEFNTNHTVNNGTNIKIKENNVSNNIVNFNNTFYLGICLLNMNNNDFYIFDNIGILMFEGSKDRRLLIQCISKLRDQTVTHHQLPDRQWLVNTVRDEVARIYKQKKSKIYKFEWNVISTLSYLNLEHYFFGTNTLLHTFQKHQKIDHLLIQSGIIDTDVDIDSNIEINKEFQNHKLKSKKRRNSLPKRFSFDVKNSKVLAEPDTRSPLELFEAVLRKLHGQYQRDELEQLCRSCEYDVSMPQITKDKIFLGNHFIKALISKFKRTSEICYGKENKIKKVLKEMGFDHSQIHDVLFPDPQETNNNFYDQVPIKPNTSAFNNKISNLNVKSIIKPTTLPVEQGDSSQSQRHKHHMHRGTLPAHQTPSDKGPASPVQKSDISIIKSKKKQSFDNDQTSEVLLSQSGNIDLFHKSIFDVLHSLSNGEISSSNTYAFQLLAKFIRKNKTIFHINDPTIFREYQKNEKRYFRLKMFTLNKRARKLIKRLYFQKRAGRFSIIKDYIQHFFKDKALIFDPPSSSDQIFQHAQILLQQNLVKHGSVPYITLHLADRDIQFTLDSGCSGNLITPKTYNFLRPIETHSYAAENIAIRTIDNSVTNNVVTRICFIPFAVQSTIFQIKFYVSRNINRNFLGTSFLLETKASMIFQESTNSHILQIKNKTFTLDFLHLNEISAESAILDSTVDPPTSPTTNRTAAENLIKENLSFSETAFKLFGNEANLNTRISDILHQYNCFPPEEMTAAAADLNYDNLTDSESYPAPEMQEFIEKRIYLPDFKAEETDPYFFENDHLTTEQTDFLKTVINNHKDAISTKSDPLGNFKLFQIAINLFPGKTAHQVKRNIDFDLIAEDIQRMETLGIISENFSTEIPTLSNLVIVSKTSRLCKADRFVKKRQDKLEKNSQQPPENLVKNKTTGTQKNPQHRLTIDLSDTNAILDGQKYINLAKYESILENLQDCYLSKLDLAEYFFSFNLDQKSKNKINFFYKNKIFSFNKLPQGVSVAPFFSVLGSNLSFSLQGLKLFLETFPELKNEEVFKISDITKLVLFYIDDCLLYTKKSLGWRSHFYVVKYLLWTFELVGLKVKMEKSQFLIFETKFLGLHLNTNSNSHYVPEKKLAAMQAWPRPLSTGELNSRLSCINFYSKYVPFFKRIAFPLIQLAKSETFIWTNLEERSWTELKFLLKFALKLSFVQPTDKLLIFCDASVLSAGFTLVKVDADLHFYPILCESRLFIKSEKRQSIVYKEALSLLLSLERCEKFIKSNFNKVLLFSDAISLSQIQKLKSTSSKLYELSLLISSFPNLQICFLKGKYNSMADLMSRSVFDAVIQDNVTDPDILSISCDVSQLIGKEVSSLSHESLQEYLLTDNQSKYIDLLTNKKRIFHIKKSYMRESSPLNTASERELLFLLMNTSKFDLRYLNLNILKDYLMTLNKSKISKNVLQDFIKYSMSKVSAETLKQLFPLTESQKNDFLAETQYNNCPEFLRSECNKLVHPLEKKIKDIKLTNDHEWVYSDTKTDVKNLDADNGHLCEANSATLSISPDKKEQLNMFLYTNRCNACTLNKGNINCIYKTPDKINLLKIIKELFVTLDTLQDNKYKLSTNSIVSLEEICSMLCFQSSNVTKVFMLVYFTNITSIENVFKLELGLNSMNNLSPIFYSCHPNFTLKINNLSIDETIIEIYLTHCITIKRFSEEHFNIDLNLMLNQDCFLQSCVLDSVIALAPNTERYPNLLLIRDIQLLNFDEQPVSLDTSKPILTLNIVYPDKEFQLLQVHKLMFEGFYENLLNKQKLNSCQYLSTLLSRQLLNQNEILAEKNPQSKILQCNSAIFNTQKENLLNVYENNLADIGKIDELFNLLFFNKNDFDKKSFMLAQKINFPQLYAKAETKKSITFVLDEGILKNKYKGKLRTVLPDKVLESTFLMVHLRGVHNMDTSIKAKILANFYSPTKNINKCIKQALKGCRNCSLFTPAPHKKYLGLTRNLTDFLQSGKNWFCDIAYVKTASSTNYLFLMVDQASSFVICKLFPVISVQKVTDFLMDIHGVISLSNCLISDSGAEHSQLLTDSLLALNIEHKRISPGASHQNTAEPSIKLIRHSLRKLINSTTQNGLQLSFPILQKLCLIAANLVNESAPYSGTYSRKQLFYGLYYFQKNHHVSRYLSEKNLLENANDLILFRNLEKFYEHRLSVLNKKNKKTNKRVSGIFLKRGDILTQKHDKNKNLVYDKNKVYFAVLRVENPRCRLCVDTIDLCSKCDILETIDVSVVNLSTGNKTRKNVNSITHVELSELLDPSFALRLRDLTSDLPDYVKRKVGSINRVPEEDTPPPSYNLRSKAHEQSSIIANFALIKKENKFFFHGRPCKVLTSVPKVTKNSSAIKSILKHNNATLTFGQLWDSWKDNMSADQLISVISALHLHLLLDRDNRTITQIYPEIKVNNYLESLLKKFFLDYKQGAITLSLSNRIRLAELCQNQGKKKVKRISFDPNINICLLDTSLSPCNNLLCKSQKCDKISCNKKLSNQVECENHRTCLLCVSDKEAKLLT